MRNKEKKKRSGFRLFDHIKSHLWQYIIFVIQNGGIAESGKHDELMARKGIYYNLNMTQA